LQVQGSDAEVIRAVGTVEGIGAKEMAQALWDVEFRREWDKGHINEWRIVGKIDEVTELHYMRVKGMFGMAERDFSDVRRRPPTPPILNTVATSLVSVQPSPRLHLTHSN